MEKAPYECDLHCHTVRSDGNDTPEELIRYAAKRGLKVVAITDHDIKPPRTVCVHGHDTDIVRFAEEHGVYLLRGIEISCETYIDDVHIVCFGCNWDDPYFDKLDAFTRNSKVKGYQELVERLNRRGIGLSWDELLQNDGKPLQDKDIQKKHIFELIARKKYTASWKEAKLIVKNDPHLNIHREKPDVISVIRTLHCLGGIVILAHPYLINEEISFKGVNLSRNEFISELIAIGLDGIEACYPYNKTSYSGRMTPAEIEKEVIKRYGGKGLIISGGSDYHADAKKGTKNPRDLGECGISFEQFLMNDKLKNLYIS